MHRTLSSILILALALNLSACSREEPKPPSQAAPQETPGWVKQKEAYEKKAQEALDDLSKQIEKWQKQATSASKEAQEEIQKQYKELLNEKGAAAKKLEELKAAGAEALDKAKTQIEAGLDKLQKTLKEEPAPAKEK